MQMTSNFERNVRCVSSIRNVLHWLFIVYIFLLEMGRSRASLLCFLDLSFLVFY